MDREFGVLDILIHNAGQGHFKKVGEMTPEEWHLNIDLPCRTMVSRVEIRRSRPAK